MKASPARRGELIESLPDDGIAIVNADDPYCQMWRELAGSRDCLTFGRSANADVTPVWSAAGHGGNVVLETPAGRARLRLTLPGRHNAMNAAAAGAAAIAAGVALDVVAAGLESMQPVSGRLQVTQVKPGLTLIDDSYNANPVSLRAGTGGPRRLSVAALAGTR